MSILLSGADMACLHGCREYYTLDHLRRLKQFEAKSSYNEGKCSDYCKDFHVQPCRACTTCHFCR